VNPFDDQYARKHLGLVPELVPISEEEFEKENLDPEDERAYATKMTKLRIDFLAKNAQQGAENTNNSNPTPKDRKGVAKSKLRAPSLVPTKRERSEPEPDSAVEDDSDQHGTFRFWFDPEVCLICRPGPPSRRRRANVDPSRTLSASSTSNRRSTVPHRSILQRMAVSSAVFR